MNITRIKNLMAVLLICTSGASASLYKGLDAEGNVVYSDKPFDNAEQFTPPAITVVDAPKAAPTASAGTDEAATEEDNPEDTRYTSFSIKAPNNNQTIWNEPDLMVQLMLTPALNIKAGHNVWLLMDGKPLVKKSRSMVIGIGRADRGQHKIQAQVRDKKGKILKKTGTVTIHIKNTVVPRKTPR